MVIDFMQFFKVVLKRKGILLLALAAGLAMGIAWQILAKKKYSTMTSFVRNQATDDLSAMGGLSSLSLLGMGGNTADPPLIKFIDKYLKSREFIAQLRGESYLGAPLAKALGMKEGDTSAEAFYGTLSSRIKVVKETGLITIRIWDRDPEFSLFLTKRIYEKFEADFDLARRKTIRENLAFAGDVVLKSRRELSESASAMRDFLERNRGLGSPALELSRNELMMKMKMAEERYLMAEKERATLEIKNERKEQGLAVIEKPFLPTSSIYPKLSVTLPVSVILAMFIAFLLIGILERRAWIRFSDD